MNKDKKKYTVRVEAFFEAAHNLREYHGKPEPLHGHSWKAEAFFSRVGLDKEGMAMDFLEAQKALEKILQPFEHAYINEIAPFDKLNPSAENVASWIYDELAKRLKAQPYRIEKVVVWEGPRYSATVETYP